ncbi:MAG TPA: ABC transporter permease, partial [Kofleriaceae bacterium]|nr:ABC transporter permease [Kofleriaceae bacterium]
CLHFHQATVEPTTQTALWWGAVKLGRLGFRMFLLTGMGIAVTIVVLLIVAQATYADPTSSATGPWAALGQRDIRSAISLSLMTATVSSLIALVIAIPTAYVLARSRRRWMKVIDALLDVPLVLSPVVIGISLLLLFRSTPGRWFESHLVRVIFEVPGIIVAQTVLALAMEIRVLKAAFEDVDPRLEQTARTLGCTPWGAFWRVTLPMARPGLIAALVLGWSRALGDFGATVTIAGAMPNKTETMPLAVYSRLESIQIGKALGLSMLLFMIAFAVLIAVRVAAERRQA